MKTYSSCKLENGGKTGFYIIILGNFERAYLNASCVERADVMLCAVDSASPLALCVSLILSLRNLMDASSATLRAALVGTGGRTCRSCRA